ncbi:unnamed protein product, partial [marine sediment metagenome]
ADAYLQEQDRETDGNVSPQRMKEIAGESMRAVLTVNPPGIRGAKEVPLAEIDADTDLMAVYNGIPTEDKERIANMRQAYNLPITGEGIEEAMAEQWLEIRRMGLRKSGFNASDYLDEAIRSAPARLQPGERLGPLARTIDSSVPVSPRATVPVPIQPPFARTDEPLLGPGGEEETQAQVRERVRARRRVESQGKGTSKVRPQTGPVDPEDVERVKRHLGGRGVKPGTPGVGESIAAFARKLVSLGITTVEGVDQWIFE